MDKTQAKKLKELEKENLQLKKLVADLSPDNAILKEVLSKNVIADKKPSVPEWREWLVTNGLGGFASGTIVGTLTRRYHELLLAALRPHGERTLLVSKLDEDCACTSIRTCSHSSAWNAWFARPEPP